jgi:uncharacterized Zn-binding protein involved in type VI secretion
MPEVARQGDPDTMGAQVDGAYAESVLINNLPAAIVGSILSSHPGGSVVSGSDSVICENQPLARVGDPTSCNHSITAGSPDVEAG